ncbi:Long-chain-alcohol oxidase FAO4A [Linum perenne]
MVESKVTVVACGAICTPPLLRRSGLKNPHIGRNLHLHPVAMAWGYFPRKSIDLRGVGEEEFERFVKEESRRPMRGLGTQLGSAHQMGSCRMGIDPAVSAVKENGETWEVEGLYVADTSVFPTALGVNPMVTVQAIAYCTGISVLDRLRRKKLGSEF